MKHDARQPDLFDSPEPARLARQPDTHARLDHLALGIKHFNNSSGRAVNKAQIIRFVQELDALHPNPRDSYILEQPRVATKIQAVLELQNAARLTNDKDRVDLFVERAEEVLKAAALEIRHDRVAILSRREGYEYKKRFRKVNEASRPYVDFTRRFVAACDAQPELASQFPHLYAYANDSRRYLALYDYADNVTQWLKPMTLEKHPFDNERRIALFKLMSPMTDRMLEQFPMEEATASIRYSLLSMPQNNFPDKGTLEAVEQSRDMWRYYASSHCRYILENINRAYKQDRKKMADDVRAARANGQEPEDACAAPGAMLDVVHEARWSLLADKLYDIVQHRFSRTMAKASVVPDKAVLANGRVIEPLKSGHGSRRI